MLDGIILYPLLTAALFHLGARAAVTEPIWSRFPTWLSQITQCPACAGFWYGLLAVGIGDAVGMPFQAAVNVYANLVIVGLASIVWTPILVALHEFSIRAVTNDRLPIAVVVRNIDGNPDEHLP